jgi:hypothetical protein
LPETPRCAAPRFGNCGLHNRTTTNGRRAFIRRRLIVVAVKAMGADCYAVHRQLQKHS